MDDNKKRAWNDDTSLGNRPRHSFTLKSTGRTPYKGRHREKDAEIPHERGDAVRAYLEKDSDGRNVLRFGTRAEEPPAADVPQTDMQASKEKAETMLRLEQARDYQLEVLGQAEQRNTIAFLETGSGKTLIAMLLMKSVAESLPRKMLAVFLVPKVPLVYQQADVVRKGTDLTVGHYCGEMVQDFWDSRKWNREFETKQVLVMTAQILLNILRHSILKMEYIDLLILDECHHAVKRHPYSLIMSEFYHPTPQEKRPKVFGMTASPVNLKDVSKQEDCAVKIRNLEATLDSVVCTIRDRKGLEKHVHMPAETIVEYDKGVLLSSLYEEIKKMEESLEPAISSVKRKKRRLLGPRDAVELHDGAERAQTDAAVNLVEKLKAILYSLQDLGQWCAYKVASSFLTSLRNDERIEHQTETKLQESYLTKIVDMLRCELVEGAAVSNKTDDLEEEEGELVDEKVASGGDHSDELLGAAVADGKVTPKVQCLIKILSNYSRTDDFQAIIFVERKVAARAIPELISELKALKFVSSGSLIGYHNKQDIRSRHKQDSLAKFRDGSVNVLVATSVAEEGLDIRQCNIVIRFDLAKTVLAYIQSRGRARKPGSEYILMLEKGNAEQEEHLRTARYSEEAIRKEAVERTKIDSQQEAAILASLEAHQEVYQVATTGATVTLNSAVALVHYYCSQLPSDRYSVLKPEFYFKMHLESRTTLYSCKLQFPPNAPVEYVDGPCVSTYRGAQQGVCLEACKILHKLGAFTDMLLPDKGNTDVLLPEKENGDKTEEQDGEALPGRARHRQYFPEGIPEAFKGDWILETEDVSRVISLYMYKIEFANIGSSNDPLITQVSNFAVLFSKELDQEIITMSVDLFVARSLTSRASLAFCGIHQFTLTQLRLIKAFHVRVMSIVLDVNVEPLTTPWDANKAYLFVPSASSSGTEIDWNLMKLIVSSDAWSHALQRARPDVHLGTHDRALGADRKEYGFGKLAQKHPTYGVRGAVAPYDVIKAAGVTGPCYSAETIEPPVENQLLTFDGVVDMDEILGKVVTVAHSGKRFYVESVRKGITAESSFPRKEGYLGPLEYSSYADYYKQKYGVTLVCVNQPMLRCRGVSHCKNLLSPRFETSKGDQELTDKTYYVMLPPELCLVHPLPARLVRGAQRLPSIMRRIQSMLLATQLKHEIGFPIHASKVLEALTAASCQEIYSYERAELLGDAYLKWMISRRLFLKFPNKHEGQLTRMRQQTVSNIVLYQYALAKGLQNYIQADRFAPSRWSASGVPQLFDEEDRSIDTDDDIETKLQPPAKSFELVKAIEVEVEDDSESLEDGEAEPDMSSYRILSSKTLADVVEALIGTFYVEGGMKGAAHFMNWIGIPIDYDFSDAEAARAGCKVPEPVMKSMNFDKLEQAIGYKFQVRSLLVEAISHASRPSAGVPCYQRLEFVGDAVLDYLITRDFYFRYPNLPPGRLTDLRAAAVNNENFARISVKHTFHLFLRHGSSALETQIQDFVKDIKDELHKPGINSFGIGDFKAPKVLGDILESIAGSIFLDTGLNTDEVWKVFEKLLQPMVTPDTLPVHPVRELQERCQQQAEGLEYKASRVGSIATVEVFVEGVQVGMARNTQKRMAQKLAARNALEVLKQRDRQQQEECGKKDDKNSGIFLRQKLNDLCLRRQWPLPQYRLLHESGPPHAKRFTYTVRVNTRERGWTDECEGQAMPSVKKAKDSAAMVLLELLKHWEPTPI